MMKKWTVVVLATMLLGMGLKTEARASDEFERPPIEYSKSEPSNVISMLQARMDRGEASLTFDDDHGYLPSLLESLKIPVESQMLVFSKTSLQLRRITPRTPRALYFNDDVYVGFCQSGDVLEISAADPKLGTVFYTLDQRRKEAPKFVRQTDNCLVCHSSSRTDGVPGHLIRSVYVDPSGQPILSAGSHTVDYRTPIEQRWGGWYVTGTHGSQTHQGNLIIHAREVPESPDNAGGMNVTDLGHRLDVARYLAPHSDIVALMVLEHQIVVHNKMTSANFTAQQALAYEADINRAFNEREGTRLESTIRRIQNAGDDLVEALLFAEEVPLKSPVVGTSEYAFKFSEMGPKDKKGRSLRELDLKTRLFKYPCSYLIYSPSMDNLPAEMREYVWKKLWNILGEGNAAAPFNHLSPDDRKAIVEILRDTKSELPAYWK